jgi:hypothetical protein
MSDVNLTEPEQRAIDAIVAAMHAVRALGHENTVPYNYVEEVVPAIHKLQMFVLMHWAHRINPDVWSDWFPDRK